MVALSAFEKEEPPILVINNVKIDSEYFSISIYILVLILILSKKNQTPNKYILKNQTHPAIPKVYRDLQSEEAREEPPIELMSAQESQEMQRHDHRDMQSWATGWVSSANPGVLGHEKKRMLKSQILTQDLDNQRFSHVIDHIQKVAKQVPDDARV